MILTFENSFFGTQEGDFALSIKSISAFREQDAKYEPYQDKEPGSTEIPMSEKDKSPPFGNPGESGKAPKAKSWISWFSGFCA